MANARTNRPRATGDGAGCQRRLTLIGLLEEHAGELQDALLRLARDGRTSPVPSAAWGGRSVDEEGAALEMMGCGQIWIQPARHGIPPGYELSFEPGELRDGRRLVASPDGRDPPGERPSRAGTAPP